jgi:hypothetical protein
VAVVVAAPAGSEDRPGISKDGHVDWLATSATAVAVVVATVAAPADGAECDPLITAGFGYMAAAS